MHPYVATVGICGLLVLAGTALSCFGVPHEEVPPEAANETHAAGGHGAGAHAWSGGKGSIPAATDALTGLEYRSRIIIDGDESWNPANGVRAGSGTFDDPFVISGYHVDTILVRDTSKAFEIKENYVSGILVLDWTGAGGYVHHNHIANLRTNRNVERMGDPTASVIENNLVLRVEELRHFDGIVRNNTIGREPLLGLLDIDGGVVFNIAGLNGAGIHDNLIFGGVDMKIHGHHHSDATGAHSHNHGAPDESQGEDHVEDHQVRYVDFLFYNNTIRDNGFGLRYNDLNHAGDDRTATSEQEPALEKPHVHHTRVAIVNNVIDGSSLRIAVMNSGDERHLPGETGELTIAKNRIMMKRSGDGLVVADVANAAVHVSGNTVQRDDLALGGSSGIMLMRFANSTVAVGENKLGAFKYGVRASEFDARTTWSVIANDAPGVQHPVYWDESVANPPEGTQPDDGHAGHNHSHADEAAAPAILGRIEAPLPR